VKYRVGDKVCSICGGNFFSGTATGTMLEGNICVECVMAYYRLLFSSRRRFNVEEFVKNGEDISEVIEILEEIDLEIEEADLNGVKIDRLFLGKNVHEKLLAAEDFFIHGVGDGELENKVLKSYRGIPVVILEGEKYKDDIDFSIF
jgi:hypothetical protein